LRDEEKGRFIIVTKDVFELLYSVIQIAGRKYRKEIKEF
jgi:hypothetical protein